MSKKPGSLVVVVIMTLPLLSLPLSSSSHSHEYIFHRRAAASIPSQAGRPSALLAAITYKLSLTMAAALDYVRGERVSE